MGGIHEKREEEGCVFRHRQPKDDKEGLYEAKPKASNSKEQFKHVHHRVQARLQQRQ